MAKEPKTDIACQGPTDAVADPTARGTQPGHGGGTVLERGAPPSPHHVNAWSVTPTHPLRVSCQEQVRSEAFLRYFSADLRAMPDAEAWCTPYAVSVHGQSIAAPDQFNGRGYGDGRAAAVGKFQGEQSRHRMRVGVGVRVGVRVRVRVRAATSEP